MQRQPNAVVMPATARIFSTDEYLLDVPHAHTGNVFRMMPARCRSQRGCARQYPLPLWSVISERHRWRDAIRIVAAIQMFRRC